MPDPGSTLATPAYGVSTNRFARRLSALYVSRTGVSLAWVLALSVLARSGEAARTPDLAIAALLVLYPLTDAAATWVDIRTTPRALRLLAQPINLVTSLVAGMTLVVAVGDGWESILAVFGGWGILSGVVQILVGWSRRATSGAHWLMLVSGAGSVFAGFTFLGWAGSPGAGVGVLVQYSTGGAVWYFLAAGWLWWSGRRDILG